MGAPYLPKSTPREVELRPALIGQVVSVQVFDKTGDDTIDTKSIKKYVGTLEAYAFVPSMSHAVIKIRGLSSPHINTETEAFEVYLYE